MVRIVGHVAAGGEYFPPSPADAAGLSPRECEVLALMAGGESNREIASRLQLSPDTVKQHAKSIYRKLRVRNRTEAARRLDELGVAAPLAA
jgi:DNA-binding NarL/FixJ family response regulator